MSTVTVERINAVITADAGQLRREVGKAIAALKGLKAEAAKSLAIGGGGSGGGIGGGRGSARVAAVRSEESEAMRVRITHMRDWRRIQADEVSRASANAKKVADAQIRESQRAAQQMLANERRAVAERYRNELQIQRTINRQRMAAASSQSAEGRAVLRGLGASGLFSAGSIKELIQLAAISAGTAALVKMVSASIRLAAGFEQTKIAFRTMVGDIKKGDSLVADLKGLARATPFTSKELLTAGSSLLGYGLDAAKITPAIRMLGDISAGTGKDIGELAIIYGQVRSTGRLMGQDLLQLVQAGFNPLEIISRKTGRSMLELKEAMADGQISFEMVEDALITATSAGGRFFDMINQQSKTLQGRFSNFMESLELTGGAIAKNLIEPLKLVIVTATKASDAVGSISMGEASAEKQGAVGVGGFVGATLIAGIILKYSAGIGTALATGWGYIQTARIAIGGLVTAASAAVGAIVIAFGLLVMKVKSLGKEILGEDAGFFDSLSEGAKALFKEFFAGGEQRISLAGEDPAAKAARQSAKRKATEADFGGGFGDWTPVSDAVLELSAAVRAWKEWRAGAQGRDDSAWTEQMDIGARMRVAVNAALEYRKRSANLRMDQDSADAFSNGPMSAIGLFPSMAGIIGILNGIKGGSGTTDKLAGAFAKGSVEAWSAITQREPAKPQEDPQQTAMLAILQAIKDKGIPITNLAVAQ